MEDDRLYPIRTRGSREYELSRRQFLELIAASAAVGYATACSQNPREQILPYSRQPLDVIPGVLAAYATSFAIDGYAMGLIAHTREGRPVKIEGHPLHPTSLGATSAFHQAAVWQLYDPDRAASVMQRSAPSTWPRLLGLLQNAPRGAGEGLRVLVEPTSSPLVHALILELKRRYPACRITFYAPLYSEGDSLATRELFGRPLCAQFDLSRADCVVSLDSDLLSTPYDLRHARAFAARRGPAQPTDDMSRLYAIEPALSVTGSMADHRLARPASRLSQLTAALAGLLMPGGPSALGRALESLEPAERRFLEVVARDLRARPAGRTLIVPGARQPPEVHILAQAANVVLGNVGQTVRFTAAALPVGSGDQPLAALTSEMRGGQVELLVMLGGNPGYDAPADLEFSGALKHVAHSVYVGPYVNETAREVQWFGPLSHPFETWSDARAFDGTLSVAQPLIQPLRSGRSVTDILAVLAQLPAASDYARLRAQFGAPFGERLDLAQSAGEQERREDPAVRARWQELLALGFARDSAFEPELVAASPSAVERAADALASAPPPGAIELNFQPSPTLHDGRFANISWLLELPEPITKLTWDNAALISPATAAQLGISSETRSDGERWPMVEVAHAGRVMRLPALIEPHHADDSVTVWLGYGRRGSERLARAVGVDAYALRTSDAPFFAPAQLTLLDEQYPVAITQRERELHGRDLALVSTLAQYREHPGFTAEHKAPLPSLLPETSGTGPQWAMTIDLSACNGCSACMVACQAENNVLVVGKAEVRRGREMHWLRIDTYHSGERVVHQPMLCQHCEKAPCEYVCPVNATVHSPDGLNEMVYNRCVGTRFCSNNCPYKVRRFNWYDWTEKEPANRGSIELQRNPEVTVRERGVMEKCTYCVQRIRSAEIGARKERRAIRPNEVVTACQQACPTRAISFGSLSDENSEMMARRREPRSYAALHETNAQPRTRYLARIDNPNPELDT
jgi:molybdopterin-containing oxidoreductase family iron-sulfur binding subunit